MDKFRKSVAQHLLEMADEERRKRGGAITIFGWRGKTLDPPAHSFTEAEHRIGEGAIMESAQVSQEAWDSLGPKKPPQGGSDG